MENAQNQEQTRQQIYDRIRESSKDEYVLEEMRRLGFWPDDRNQPSLPAQLIEREAELARELNELLKKQRRYENRERALMEMRKQRLEESRRKQAETKERKKQEREEKARQWQAFKEKEIIYLGEGVSGGLQERTSSVERLHGHNLPVFADIEDLAKSMGVTVGELRFLAYSRKTSKISHYKRFHIPKKRGGKRLISAPMPRLKNVQTWILDNILSKTAVRESVHGFARNRSIVTNAKPHLGSDVVVNQDLKDFFPTVTYRRVKGVFVSLGYSEQIATVFALICTEPDIDEIVLDRETWYVAGTERHLPQGAPTSPAITNLICSKMDARLLGMARQLDFAYTRYADDLTFSASDQAVRELPKLLWRTRKIVEAEGFALHPEKLRIMRKGVRQEVTGIVVNEKPGVNRKSLKKFRALLYQIEKDGIDGKHWNGSETLLASIKGYADFISMVDRQKGRALAARVKRILDRYGYKHEIRHKAKTETSVVQTGVGTGTEESLKKKPWWKLW